MTKRANHHPQRVIVWGQRPHLTARHHAVRGPRQRRTEVFEFNLRGPDGYCRLPANIPTERAHSSVLDKCLDGGNSKPGPYRRGITVEGKARPIRKG